MGWKIVPEKPESKWKVVDEISGGESFLRGGAQSLSIGFADEAEAGIRAALDPEKEYKDYIDPIRKDYEAAQQAHPYISAGGSIAGSLITGMGVAGLVGKAAKGVGALAKGAQFIQGTKTGAGILGAAEGATAGYGLSDDGSLKDVGVGAVTGGILGAAGKGLADKLSKPKPNPISTIETTGGVAPVTSAEISQTADDAAAVFGKPDLRKDANAVKEAWESLAPGQKMPSYLLTKDRPVRELADDVLSSSTIAGHLERQALKPGYKAVEAVADEIAAESGNISKSEAGRLARNLLNEAFEKEIEAPSAIYQQLEEGFKDLPIRKMGLNRALKSLEKQYGWQDESNRVFIDRLRSMSNNIDTVDKLRTARTNLSKNYLPETMTDNQKKILSDFYNAMTRERNRSILANAFQDGPAEAVKLSRDDAARVLQDLQKADAEWARVINKYSAILPVGRKAGVSPYYKISNYLTDEQMPLEQYVTDLFDKGDIASLQRLKETSPQVFDVLRRRQLGGAVEGATNKMTNQVSPQGVIGQVGGIKDEATRKMILGEALAKKFEQARTLQSAFPPNANPSGTATKLMNMSSLYDPIREIPRQAQYMGKRSMLNKGVTSDSLQGSVLNAAKRLQPRTVIEKLSANPETSVWAGTLQQALQRGEASYSATFFLLSQTEPTFREAVNESETTGY